MASRHSTLSPVPALAAVGLRLAAVTVLGAGLIGCASPSDGASDAPSVPTGPSRIAPSPPVAVATAVIAAPDLVENLEAPWSLAFVPDGSALVTERDEATVKQVVAIPEGGYRTQRVGQVKGVDNDGEGGLLGIAIKPSTSPPTTAQADGAAEVYLYWSTATDNRIGVAAWDGTSLGTPQVILSGIPHAAIHNGGRLAFGPDGTLFVGTGDASDADSAQDPASLAGKILRINPDGSVPVDNPVPDSPVYSLGHRNVQGLAFDAQGQLWASEFGAADADELNLIVAGGNYGWPEVEGAAGDSRYLDPVTTWMPTAVASPSGMAIAEGSAWVAALRGEALWQVPLAADSAGSPIAHFTGEFGRLRDSVQAPDGSLWLLTNNTDGRGSPTVGDDRIVRITLE